MTNKKGKRQKSTLIITWICTAMVLINYLTTSSTSIIIRITTLIVIISTIVVTGAYIIETHKKSDHDN